MSTYNISSVAASVASMLGVPAPEHASPAYAPLADRKMDRVLLYNPDAVALWLYEKYKDIFTPVTDRIEMELPSHSFMPSVTPVCFGSMYTGAEPAVHGIQKYEKPIITIETLFDVLIKAGKKPAIVSATPTCSISKIFLDRKMDYYIFTSLDRVNETALKLMEEDKYDLITVYNGNYDSTMHKNGPEAEVSLNALRHNTAMYATLYDHAKKVWAGKNWAMGFCPDHGCHEIDGECGSHGLDTYEDMNVIHFWGFGK